jgi:hypothetical protein
MLTKGSQQNRTHPALSEIHVADSQARRRQQQYRTVLPSCRTVLHVPASPPLVFPRPLATNLNGLDMQFWHFLDEYDGAGFHLPAQHMFYLLEGPHSAEGPHTPQRSPMSGPLDVQQPQSPFSCWMNDCCSGADEESAVGTQRATATKAAKDSRSCALQKLETRPTRQAPQTRISLQLDSSTKGARSPPAAGCQVGLMPPGRALATIGTPLADHLVPHQLLYGRELIHPLLVLRLRSASIIPQRRTCPPHPHVLFQMRRSQNSRRGVVWWERSRNPRRAALGCHCFLGPVYQPDHPTV